MPGFDGTGPRGMGPMTGGGRGFCNPASPLNAGAVPYRPAGYGAGLPYRGWGGRGGWGAGMGFGRAVGWGPAPAVVQPDPVLELGYLEGQAQALSQQLEAVRARINELQAQMPDES